MKCRFSVSLFALALLVVPAVAQETSLAIDVPGEEVEVDNDGTGAEGFEDDNEGEEALEEGEETISPAAKATLEQARICMEKLADMMAAVVDPASAAAMASRIAEAYESLKYTDWSSLADEDEELVAAEFAEDMVVRLDAEIERLSDAGFYGNQHLLLLFSAQEKSSDSLHAKENDATIEKEVDIPAQEAGTESVGP